jgi:hypothetical protein
MFGKDNCLLGCCTVQSGRSVLIFQRYLLPPSPGWWAGNREDDLHLGQWWKPLIHSLKGCRKPPTQKQCLSRPGSRPAHILFRTLTQPWLVPSFLSWLLFSPPLLQFSPLYLSFLIIYPIFFLFPSFHTSHPFLLFCFFISSPCVRWSPLWTPVNPNKGYILSSFHCMPALHQSSPPLARMWSNLSPIGSLALALSHPLPHWSGQGSTVSDWFLYQKPIPCVRLTHHPDDGDSKYLWNVSKLLPDYKAQQPRRQSSYLLPWEPEISSMFCEL